MPREAIELIGSPGIIRDTPAHKLPNNGFSDGNNFRFADEGAEALVGDLEVLSDTTISPLWFHPFPPVTNPLWVYANTSKVYAINGDTHTEITRSASDYSGLPTQRWHGSMFNGVGILNNTADVPQAWNPVDDGTLLVDLPNWDTNRRCRSLRPFRNYLVALYLTDSGIERPYRILWSDSAAAGTVPGSWDSTDPATDSREFDLAQTEDYLMDSLQLGEINVIYKERSVWGMRFIGPPRYFAFWNILPDDGLLARECVRPTPKGHLVVTQDDIILHRGQVNERTSILTQKYRTWLFQNIDPDSFYNSFLMVDIRKQEAHFCFPEVGEVYATRVLSWNWRYNSLNVRDIPATPYGVMGAVGSELTEDFIWG